MNATEIVERDPQRHGCLVILQFLAESIAEPNYAPHAHAGAEVETLDIGRADLFTIGQPSYHSLIDASDMSRRVTMSCIGQA